MSDHEPDHEPGAPESPAAEWFYVQRGETYGPVSSAELLAAAHLGFLGPDDMVLRQGRSRWVHARSVPGLFEVRR